MKLKMCVSCKGAKEVVGMGFISMEKCQPCGGIGHVPDLEDAEIDAILQTKSVVDSAAPALVKPEEQTPEKVLEQLVEPKPKPNARKKSVTGSRAKAKA